MFNCNCYTFDQLDPKWYARIKVFLQTAVELYIFVVLGLRMSVKASQRLTGLLS